VARGTWLNLIPNSTLQPNCNLGGININPAPSTQQRVRIGILGNNEADCLSADSRLGIGGYGDNCVTLLNQSVGNTTRCGGHNGDADLTTFGYVRVRSGATAINTWIGGALTTSCTVGVGACARTGTFVCRGDGTGTQCSVSPGSAAAETCNGIDDDCNGVVDDIAPTSCSLGACSTAEARCPLTTAGVTVAAVCVRTGYVAAGTVCRANNGGGCDAPETCTGNTDACPADVGVANGTVCRANNGGGCDVAETCNGSSAACPADVAVANGTVCRANNGGGCDVAETCNGTPAACPADQGVANGTVCRASTNQEYCDPTERCNGSSAACPTNTVIRTPTTEICNGVDDNCNGQTDEPFSRSSSCVATTETCNGVDDDCDGVVDDVLTLGTSTCPARTCTTILRAGRSVGTGYYWIDPDGAGGQAASEVWCDMSTADGGWTLVGRSRPGGWAPGCAGTDGGSNFGWRSAQGAVRNDSLAYAYNAAGRGLRFSELLFGDYGTGKAWGSYVYRRPVPLDFITNPAYQTGTIDLSFPPIIVNSACPVGSGWMFRYMGFTNNTDTFYFRDVPGNGYGLTATGWGSCYNDCYSGGGLNGRQGQIMVRGVTPGVDTGFLTQPCTVGIGACARTGAWACSSDGSGTVCVATPGSPSAETCNGVDDNCNGSIDDGNPGGGAACTSGGTGTCVTSGTRVCSGGTLICNATPRTSGSCIVTGAGNGTFYNRTASPIAWINACTGTYSNLLPNIDDGTASATLPFAFTFYGTTYNAGTTVGVSSNGLVGFPSVSSSFSNGSLATSGLTNTIAAFWDDLFTRSPGICVRTIGTSPSRQMIIQWNNAYGFSGSLGNYYFQVVLNEGSNAIDLRFNSMSGGSYYNGSSATVGIIRDSTTYDEYSSNTASIASGTNMRWTPINRACNSSGTCATSFSLVGVAGGVSFYRVPVSGAMTDNNIRAACLAAGLRVPCQTNGSCAYNDTLCVRVGPESSCGNPMYILSQTICGGQYPSGCPALSGVFQYMGNAWVGGCGAFSGQWCAQGNSYSNQHALCVP
jgi:hypothetical protein